MELDVVVYGALLLFGLIGTAGYWLVDLICWLIQRYRHGETGTCRQPSHLSTAEGDSTPHGERVLAPNEVRRKQGCTAAVLPDAAASPKGAASKGES
jgi:hypothetical protein